MTLLADLLLRAWDWFQILWPILVLIAVALQYPQPFAVLLDACLRLCARMGRNRRRAILTFGLGGFIVAAYLSLVNGVRVPSIHDEFAHLLAADTFVLGRLSNPSHPMGTFFESFNILQRPSYASKYPPLQGLTLAPGKLFGLPILGVWIGGGLATAALCWMLLNWVPARWAVLTSLLFVLHRTYFDWVKDYWSVPVTIAGGALVVGTLPRLVRRPRARDGWWFGAGTAILAHTRTYEGGVVVLATAATGVILILWRRRSWASLARRVLGPIAVCFLLTLGSMAYYNLRVTGDPLRFPYREHMRQYRITPLFIWQPLLPEPSYNHPRMREFFVRWEAGYVRRHRGAVGLARETSKKSWTLIDTAFLAIPKGSMTHRGGPLSRFVRSHFRYTPAVPVLFLPCAIVASRKARAAATIFSAGVIGSLLIYWVLPHYTAPTVGAFALLMVMAMRAGFLYKRKTKRVGAALVALILLIVVSFVPWNGIPSAESEPSPARHRERLRRALHQMPGEHLVIVHYPPGLIVGHFEWVYNEADLDRAKVLWARDMGPKRNRVLIDYFPGRRVWSLQGNEPEPFLQPYGK